MDKITISDIQVFAFHGAFKEEIENGQNFHIDCTYSIETSTIVDDIYDTIIYEQVCQDINDFLTINRFNLIETLANALAKNLLQKYQQIKTIEIGIHKPNAPIKVPFNDVFIKITRGWHFAYLALNSSLDNKKEFLDSVLEAINKDPNCRTLKQSTYIENEDFLTGVIKIKTCYTPVELLDFSIKVENEAKAKQINDWEKVPLNINILMYDDIVKFSEKLILPYPELHFKKQILQPLNEIEPYLIHPIKRKSINELLAELHS